jgi:transcriptional regulator with XRE-family HTH domain
MWVDQKEYLAVGARLSTLRKESGFSQTELAAAIKKPQSFVSSYERGQRRIDILELLVIASALEVNPTEAFAAITDQLGPRRHKLRKLKPGA